MRFAKWLWIPLLALAGGLYWTNRTPAAIAVCEDYWKQTLAAPSTYQRIKASSGIVEAAKRPDGHEYQVLIEFDANNLMGVPLREQRFCAWPLMSQRRIPPSDTLKIMAEGALARQLIARSTGHDADDGCCD